MKTRTKYFFTRKTSIDLAKESKNQFVKLMLIRRKIFDDSTSQRKYIISKETV